MSRRRIFSLAALLFLLVGGALFLLLPRSGNVSAARAQGTVAERSKQAGKPDISRRLHRFRSRVEAMAEVADDESRPATMGHVGGAVLAPDGEDPLAIDRVIVRSPDCGAATEVEALKNQLFLGNMSNMPDFDRHLFGMYNLRLPTQRCTLQAEGYIDGKLLLSPEVQYDVQPGYDQQVSLQLAADRSDELGVLRVRVVDFEGEDLTGPFRVRSRDCGFSVSLPDDKEHAEFELRPGRCSVYATRRDGVLMARSEVLTADVEAGGFTELVLPINPVPTGGIGVRISAVEQGILVASVREGDPAFKAGLQKGDIITEVEGMPTAGMDLQEFVDRMTGPEGSDVEFVVAYPTDDGELLEESVLLQRSFLEPR